jgi:hypothetical protein
MALADRPAWAICVVGPSIQQNAATRIGMTTRPGNKKPPPGFPGGGFFICGGQLHKQNGRRFRRPL